MKQKVILISIDGMLPSFPPPFIHTDDMKRKNMQSISNFLKKSFYSPAACRFSIIRQLIKPYKSLARKARKQATTER